MFRNTRILTAAAALGMGLSACSGLLNDIKAAAEDAIIGKAFDAFADKGFGQVLEKNLGAVGDAVDEAASAAGAPAYAPLAEGDVPAGDNPVKTDIYSLDKTVEKDGSTISVTGEVTKTYDADISVGTITFTDLTVAWNAKAAGLTTAGKQLLTGTMPFGATDPDGTNITLKGDVSFNKKKFDYDVKIVYTACDAATVDGKINGQAKHYELDLSSGKDCHIVDADGDAVADRDDNCPAVANADQADADGDGIGAVCDDSDAPVVDTDSDGLADEADNCPTVNNVDQADADGDVIGDACDADADGDNVDDATDNCLGLSNDQTDVDADGVGDACDANIDSDGDLISNDTDNCVTVANADQADADTDGIGNACEADTDGDAVIDDTDNCNSVANADQTDADGDGIGAACDSQDNPVTYCPKSDASSYSGGDHQHCWEYGDGACECDLSGAVGYCSDGGPGTKHVIYTVDNLGGFIQDCQDAEATWTPLP